MPSLTGREQRFFGQSRTRRQLCDSQRTTQWAVFQYISLSYLSQMGQNGTKNAVFRTEICAKKRFFLGLSEIYLGEKSKYLGLFVRNAPIRAHFCSSRDEKSTRATKLTCQNNLPKSGIRAKKLVATVCALPHIQKFPPR